MKHFYLRLAACVLAACSQTASAALITASEYFIDIDPGQGKGIAAPASSPGATNSFNIQIPPPVIAALPEGIHTLGCRSQDDQGNWSIAFYRTFFKEGPTPALDVIPPTAGISAVSPDPRNNNVDSLSIVFSEPVAGLAKAGLSLRRDGGPNLLTDSQLLTTTDNITYTLGGLGVLTTTDGAYTFTLSAADSGVADGAGNRLQSDASETWMMDQTPPTVAIATVAPDPRNTGLSSVAIAFNEPVAGLSLSSLSLTRNGGANLLTAAQTLTTTDSKTFELAGLGVLTASAGDYALSLKAAGVTDRAGNGLASDAAESWVNDQTSPSVAISAITPDPRNNAVDSATIVFSEPVTGFVLASLSLARNGSANLLTASQILTSADNRTFALSGLAALTVTNGSYTLSLNTAGSGVADRAGNPPLAGAAETWVMDRTPPTVAIGPVSPSPRNSAVVSLTLDFSEPVDGLSIQDLSLTRNGGANLLTGLEALVSSDSKNFTLSGLAGLTAAEGSYLLKLPAANSGISDGAGNLLSADSTMAWTVDRTPPTAQFVAIAPNPRPTALDSATIFFSEPVTGLDALDLFLARDGGTNLLVHPGSLGSADNSTFVLQGFSGLTAVDGEYTLTLRGANSGIADAAGNALAEGAIVTWRKAANLTVVAEYFIDIDPGQGNGTPIVEMSPVWPLTLGVDIPASVIAALSDGPHVLSCRVRDQKGVWSLAFTRTFHKGNPIKDAASVVQFIEIQWFRDGAAIGEAELIPVPAPTSEVSLSLRAGVASLKEAGVYQVLATPINSLGNRGFGASRTVLFEVAPPSPVLAGLRRLADGSFELNIAGASGTTYVLQSSTNLAQWMDLQIASPGNSVRVGGDNVASPQMFFRLKTP